MWLAGAFLQKTQVFTPGVHDISVSPTGSDATCQFDETKPCKTVRVVLHRSFRISHLHAVLNFIFALLSRSWSLLFLASAVQAISNSRLLRTYERVTLSPLQLQFRK